jgi:broad specificity phosphatase PhoE
MDVRLVEKSFGVLEGIRKNVGRMVAGTETYWEMYDLGGMHKWCAFPPGGESYEMVRMRLDHFCLDTEFSRDHDTLIITHGGVSHILRGLLLGLDHLDSLELPRQNNHQLYAVNDWEGTEHCIAV